MASESICVGGGVSGGAGRRCAGFMVVGSKLVPASPSPERSLEYWALGYTLNKYKIDQGISI